MIKCAGTTRQYRPIRPSSIHPRGDRTGQTVQPREIYRYSVFFHLRQGGGRGGGGCLRSPGFLGPVLSARCSRAALLLRCSAFTVIHCPSTFNCGSSAGLPSLALLPCMSAFFPSSSSPSIQVEERIVKVPRKEK